MKNILVLLLALFSLDASARYIFYVRYGSDRVALEREAPGVCEEEEPEGRPFAGSNITDCDTASSVQTGDRYEKDFRGVERNVSLRGRIVICGLVTDRNDIDYRDSQYSRRARGPNRYVLSVTCGRELIAR